MRSTVIAWMLAVAACGGAELRVSPQGPIQSLSEARDAVRKLRTAGATGAVSVVFEGGTYASAEAVEFAPEDSNVSYEAAPGAKPALVWGRRIRNFKQGENGVWTAQLEPTWRFESFWVNGKRAVRARTPNLDPDGIPTFIEATGQPTEALPGVPLDGPPNRTLLQVPPEALSSLNGLTPDEIRDMVVYDYHSWSVNHHRLVAARPTDGILQFTNCEGYEFFSPEPDQRIHLENYKAALDAPGEWFLARDGTLSYIPTPGENIDQAEAWAPVSRRWIVLKGEPEKSRFVENVTFKNLKFLYQNYETPPKGFASRQGDTEADAAIEMDGVRHVQFTACELAHTSSYCFEIRRGCHEVDINACYIHDLGAGGAKIGDPGVSTESPEQTDHIRFENDIIHTGGRGFPSAVGLILFNASDCVFRHCDIADFFYTGISMGWHWGYQKSTCARNIIDSCRIHHLGWGVLSDMGAVYTLGPQLGTVIKNCHFHDIGRSSYGGWGMYNDEGSTGVLWVNNLVHDTQDAGYHMHYGRGDIVRNNIIAFCREENLRRSRPEEQFAFEYDHNILLVGPPKVLGHIDGNWLDGRVSLNGNLYWKPGGTVTNFAGKTWDEWQRLGEDVNSVIADPLFKDAEHGDWSLDPRSPALAMGFQPFDWTQAGVQGSEAWKSLAAEAFPKMHFGAPPPIPPLQLHDGFELTPAGAPPAEARVSAGAKGYIVVAEEEASKGGHSLRLTDGPELKPAFEPHFYYLPHHTSGTTRVVFDVKSDPAFHLVHEWRDDAAPYHTGPALEFHQGVVSSRGRKLIDAPEGSWIHVEMEAKLGDASEAQWTCTLTVQGDEPRRFEGLPFVNPEMKHLEWLGFSGADTQAAKAWLDEIDIKNVPAPNG